MGNLFRLPNGKLDKKYLRVCAVYRMVTRFGFSEAWAAQKLQERGIPITLLEMWRTSKEYQEACRS